MPTIENIIKKSGRYIFFPFTLMIVAWDAFDSHFHIGESEIERMQPMHVHEENEKTHIYMTM